MIGSTKEVLSLERPGRASNQSPPKVTTAWLIRCNRLISYAREACWNMLKQRMCRRVWKDVDEGNSCRTNGQIWLEKIHKRILETTLVRSKYAKMEARSREAETFRVKYIYICLRTSYQQLRASIASIASELRKGTFPCGAVSCSLQSWLANFPLT